MAVEFDGERMVKKTANDCQSDHPRRPICACTAYSCNKLFLFVYSCLHVVVGGSLLLLGLWIELYGRDFEAANNDLFIPAILLMSIGLILILNSVTGISGTVRENTCCLTLFLILTVLIFLGQVAIGVLAFLYRQEVPEMVSDNLMYLVKDYSSNNYYQKTMDNLQSFFQCCGFDSYMDYEENQYFQCGSEYPQKCGVPWSCCKISDPSGLRKVNCGYEVRWNSTMPVDKIYTMGCTESFMAWLGWNLDFVGMVGLGTAIPQIIGILLTYFFIRQVKEMKMWYRVGM